MGWEPAVHVVDADRVVAVAALDVDRRRPRARTKSAGAIVAGIDLNLVGSPSLRRMAMSLPWSPPWTLSVPCLSDARTPSTCFVLRACRGCKGVVASDDRGHRTSGGVAVSAVRFEYGVSFFAFVAVVSDWWHRGREAEALAPE
jgi:hypothetical protein